MEEIHRCQICRKEYSFIYEYSSYEGQEVLVDRTFCDCHYKSKKRTTKKELDQALEKLEEFWRSIK